MSEQTGTLINRFIVCVLTDKGHLKTPDHELLSVYFDTEEQAREVIKNVALQLDVKDRPLVILPALFVLQNLDINEILDLGQSDTKLPKKKGKKNLSI